MDDIQGARDAVQFPSAVESPALPPVVGLGATVKDVGGFVVEGQDLSAHAWSSWVGVDHRACL